MSAYGLKRHIIRKHVDDVSGWRLLLPTLPFHFRRRYHIGRDVFVSGWWWFALGVSAERLGAPAHGVALRLTWGWVASDGVVWVPRKEAVAA